MIRKLSYKILSEEDGPKLIKMKMIGIFIGPPSGPSEIFSTPNQVSPLPLRNPTHRSPNHQSLPQPLLTHQERPHGQKSKKVPQGIVKE